MTAAPRRRTRPPSGARRAAAGRSPSFAARAGRAARLVIALVLLPVCAATAQTLFALLVNLPGPRPAGPSADTWAIVLGFTAWCAIYLALPRPFRAYVLAHELTHALWGLIFGARVSKLRVGETGGSVTLSHTNFLVTLAPYFFPFYTLLVLAAYGTAAVFLDVSRFRPAWLSAIGFTWAFHVTFTVSSMLQRQPDIVSCGRVFSAVFIALLNLASVCLWIVAVTRATLEQTAGMLGLRLVGQFTALAAVGRRAADFLQ